MKARMLQKQNETRIQRLCHEGEPWSLPPLIELAPDTKEINVLRICTLG